MTTAAAIQAGNSDDKLTQQEWARFVSAMRSIVEAFAYHTHFFGGSATYAAWQNVCWVIEIREESKEDFCAAITHARKQFKQDSVSVVFGDTMFV